MNSNLKGYRNMMNLTQSEMASRLEISTASYSNKEIGKKDFSQTEIEKIMSMLKVYRPLLTYEEVFLRIV